MYFSTPAIFDRLFPKAKQWLEDKFEEAAHQHDMSYGKWFTIRLYGRTKHVWHHFPTNAITRFKADNYFFLDMLKVGWQHLPFACIIRIYFFMFGGWYWDSNKRYRSK